MARFNPLEFFLLAKHMPRHPEDVRVFSRGRFLYASFDDGQEQVLNMAEVGPEALEDYWRSFDGGSVFRGIIDAAAE